VVKLRRLHFADTAGILLAVLLILAGLAALVRPDDVLVFHATGDMTGGSAGGVIERFDPERVRLYGAVALMLGIGLATFLVWALRSDDNTSI
jgi:hypothetical protein